MGTESKRIESKETSNDDDDTHSTWPIGYIGSIDRFSELHVAKT